MYPFEQPTRHVNPTEEVLGDLPRYRVRGANRMLGSTLRQIDLGKSQRRKNTGRECSLFVVCLIDKTLRVNGILPKPAGSYK
jgi:hypothetical protein